MGREARIARSQPKTPKEPTVEITGAGIWTADELKANLLKTRKRKGKETIDIVLPETSEGRTIAVDDRTEIEKLDELFIQ